MARTRGIRWVSLTITAALALEVVVTVLVAGRIGILALLLWFVVAFALGVGVLRRSAVVRRTAPTGEGRSIGDALVLVVAGLLLIVPGVLGDLVAVLLLIPPVGALVRGRVAAASARRYPDAAAAWTRVQVQEQVDRTQRSPYADGVVIEGEVVEDDEQIDPRD